MTRSHCLPACTLSQPLPTADKPSQLCRQGGNNNGGLAKLHLVQPGCGATGRPQLTKPRHDCSEDSYRGTRCGVSLPGVTAREATVCTGIGLVGPQQTRSIRFVRAVQQCFLFPGAGSRCSGCGPSMLCGWYVRTYGSCLPGGKLVHSLLPGLPGGSTQHGRRS